VPGEVGGTAIVHVPGYSDVGDGPDGGGSSEGLGVNGTGDGTSGRNGDAANSAKSLALTVEVLSLDDASAGSPLLLAVEGFLSPGECAHIAALARARLQPSLVVGSATGESSDGSSSSSSSSSGSSSSKSSSGSNTGGASSSSGGTAAVPVGARASSSCWLSASGASPVLSRVRARAAALLGLELNTFAPHAEDLQVQKGRLRPPG
jgi:hypothetical protein